MAGIASATVQAPLASIRIAPVGPSARRTAATRSRSAASSIPGSATLTLAVRHPDAATRSAARAGSMTGTMMLTGTRSRRGSGQPTVADSIAARSHGTHCSSE